MQQYKGHEGPELGRNDPSKREDINRQNDGGQKVNGSVAESLQRASHSPVEPTDQRKPASRSSIVLYLRPLFHCVNAEWMHAEGRRRRSGEVNEIPMRCQGVLTLRDEKSGLKGEGRSGWIDCTWGGGESGHTVILVFAKSAWDEEACKDEAEGRKRRREQKSEIFEKDMATEEKGANS